MNQVIVSILLISIPATLTVTIASFQIYFLLFNQANRISKEIFFGIRRKLARARLIFNLIAIIFNFVIGFDYIAFILILITFSVTGIDVGFYLLEKTAK